MWVSESETHSFCTRALNTCSQLDKLAVQKLEIGHEQTETHPCAHVHALTALALHVFDF